MKKNILILEDDEQFRNYLETILIEEGYRVTTVGDGKQGLARLAHERFDLIVTDIFMPETDGLRFLLEIGKRNLNVKVIGMSGGGARMFPREALEMSEAFGAQKSISKPFTKKEIVPLVQEMIG